MLPVVWANLQMSQAAPTLPSFSLCVGSGFWIIRWLYNGNILPPLFLAAGKSGSHCLLRGRTTADNGCWWWGRAQGTKPDSCEMKDEFRRLEKAKEGVIDDTAAVSKLWTPGKNWSYLRLHLIRTRQKHLRAATGNSSTRREKNYV